MRYFWMIGLYVGLVYGGEMDRLLEHYQEASELSKKTKDESRGHLTIYTRDDLERMQVETLKDLLKSLRFSRYLENRLGDPDLFNNDPIVYNSKSVRIYINEHEMVVPITGSGFFLFGNIDLDFVDHVEVYQGFPSFDFAIEPASVVIKLYTKSAKRDAGSRIKGEVASHYSHKENFYTAGYTSQGDVAYFLYANHTDDRRERRQLGSDLLSRDRKVDHLYTSVEKGQHLIEMQAFWQKSDNLLGLFPYVVPEDTYTNRTFFNVSYSYFSEDKRLALHASYLKGKITLDEVYTPTLPVLYGGYSHASYDKRASALTLLSKKKFTIGKHAISLGLQYRHKSFTLDDFTYDSIINTVPQYYNKETIYSLFLEDYMSITESDLVGISLMQQYYKRDGKMHDETIPQARLSYIHADIHDDVSFTAKTFFSYREMMPDPIATATTHMGNPKLTAENIIVASQEFGYKKGALDTKVVIGSSRTQGYLVPNTRGVMQNSDKRLTLKFASLEMGYQFRAHDRLRLMWSYLNVSGDDTDKDVKLYNCTIQMLNTIGKFDLFNELVINKNYGGVKDGYDYSMGVRYRITKDLHIKLKGENIFDSGLTQKFLYRIPTEQIEVPVIERKFRVGLEYLF